jgi:signal transduction histidine kinase
VKPGKNYVTLSLMITSLVLLAALQIVWLRNSYEKAAEDLRSETGRMLRESVIALRDSLLLKNIETLPPDSSQGTRYTQKRDTTFMFLSGAPAAPRSDGQVQVYISSSTGEDSVKQMLRSVASGISEGRFRTNSRFSIRLRNDSVPLDSIQAALQRQLKKKGLNLTAIVTRKGSMPPIPPTGHGTVRVRRMMDPEGEIDEANKPSLFAAELESSWIRTDPFFRYAALLSPVRPLLLREIAPQILFSGFLTLLTLGSFMVMYRSIRSQQRLMALKNDFISNITHELKTPIATVSVALEALKNFKGMDNPRLTAEYLDIAQLELKRLSLLTEKVLTTSLFEENGVTMDRVPVDLEEMVNSVVNSFKPMMEKANATFTFERLGSDFVVSGSAIHLANVLYNLLDNALKYSPEKPEIGLQLKEDGGRVQLLVNDKGLGIAAEYQSKIFERFFRMPTGDVHNIKGYGLGLSYVDQVVRKHGGTISVSSTPGQGSTFTVSLPKQPA